MSTPSHSRFKFLDPYGKGDEKIFGFFGRDGETLALYDLVMRTNLVLLYGVTGVGKSSLVRCGLASRIDESRWDDLYIRRGNDLNEAFRAALSDRIDALRSTAAGADDDLDDLFEQHPQKPDNQNSVDDSIPALLDTLYLYTFKPIYLVFDQFEEIFTLGTHAEREAFFRTLRMLQRADAHKVKIVLVMREEYFASLDAYEHLLPGLGQNRLRVERMSSHNLEQVISGTLEKAGIAFDSGIPGAVIRKLSPGGSDRVELTHLQMLLDKLDRLADERHQGFTLELMDATGELRDIVGEFLVERVREFATSPEDLDLAWQLLKQLITPQGTKRPLLRSELVLLSPRAALLTDGFIRSGILRADGDRVELMHDILAAAIDRRRTGEERALIEAQLLVERSLLQHSRSGAWLSADDLRYLSPLRNSLKLNPEQETFLNNSQQAANRALRRERIRSRMILAFGAGATLAAVAAVWLAFSARHAQQQAEASACTANQALKGFVNEKLIREREKLVKFTNAQEPTLIQYSRRRIDSLEHVLSEIQSCP